MIEIIIIKDALEFTDEEVVGNLILKYSEFINFPIIMRSKKKNIN